MSQYNFDIKYIKRINNTVADFLSWYSYDILYRKNNSGNNRVYSWNSSNNDETRDRGINGEVDIRRISSRWVVYKIKEEPEVTWREVWEDPEIKFLWIVILYNL